ncbi:unnamed protein product [Dovyalis caffra]|uniref:Protein kinase domain-containing protein n=1 Tax=Dovyalis caffra TaxID=77055 RepID=A0AAV1SB62_9ROSI|nr:unnamed protein product [Dovyalis caffra]
MEKKVDTSSPVGVLEDYFKSEESESCSSKEPTSDEAAQKVSKPASRWQGFVKLFRSRSKNPIGTLHPLSVLKLSMRKSNSMRESIITTLFSNADSGNFKSPRINFALSELQAATNNFNQENLIGKGGYAEVYKGCLQNGKIVAIKRLTRGTVDEIIGDFLSEMGIMAHVDHPNTAKLIGYGVEGGMHLVLELSPLGSLASICDFGLAKWLPEHWTHHTVSKFEGTFGYLAPEYLMHGIVDEKTDVFAFGVLLLELVTGRRALDYSQQSLVLWAKPLLKNNEIRELVDPALVDDYNARQMNLVLLAASLCIQQSSIRRPLMIQVVQLLNVLMKQVLATWAFKLQISWIFYEIKDMVLASSNFAPTHAHM